MSEFERLQTEWIVTEWRGDLAYRCKRLSDVWRDADLHWKEVDSEGVTHIYTPIPTTGMQRFLKQYQIRIRRKE